MNSRQEQSAQARLVAKVIKRIFAHTLTAHQGERTADSGRARGPKLVRAEARAESSSELADQHPCGSGDRLEVDTQSPDFVCKTGITHACTILESHNIIQKAKMVTETFTCELFFQKKGFGPR